MSLWQLQRARPREGDKCGDSCRTESQLRQRDLLAVRTGARLVGDGIDRGTNALVVHVPVVAVPGAPPERRRQRQAVVCGRGGSSLTLALRSGAAVRSLSSTLLELERRQACACAA